MEEDLKEIGLRIKGLREACDVTQEELAQDLGVDVTAYQQWSRGRMFPSRWCITLRASSVWI